MSMLQRKSARGARESCRRAEWGLGGKRGVGGGRRAARGGETGLQHDQRKDALQRVGEAVDLARCAGGGLLAGLKRVGDGARDADHGQGGEADLGAAHKLAEEAVLAEGDG